ncbi:GntR family transcriptional regulator [Xinfangfangia sp. D13-10-4-6]|uniref:GntR family transcriptional regulator n=1 Tax=Pseudogemmobacter hezensis TaxID=2737662 RepID=UPI0015541C9B|nr:GntR family transcriptional regulator [Pseudogemmobacter hezensis]NPD16835.1 GntR family transcriptional regulator [Pseudogemmobacter hezensis]
MPDPVSPQTNQADTLPEAAPGIRMTDAYLRIRQAILEGELPPGGRLSQVRIADRLGLSRTPVREALRLIEKEGLITSERGRQVVISPTSMDDLDELYALRIKLDTTTVRSTVPDLTEADIAGMRDCLAQMKASADPAHFAEFDAAHRAFHMIPIRLAGARHVDFSTRLNEHAGRYRRLYLTQPRSYQQSGEEHEAIMEACAARDGERVALLLADHFARIALTIIAQIDPAFEPRQVRSALRVARGGTAGPRSAPEKPAAGLAAPLWPPL